MTQSDRSVFSEAYTIDTPENVSFGYEVVGIGSRFIGALIDSAIILAALFLMNLVVFGLVLMLGDGNTVLDPAAASELDWVVGLLLALYALLNFLIFWGYYIFFEFIWNGQTPGKRVADIRVVRADGNPLGLLENVVRNLVRIIDFLPTAYILGIITMFANRHARRLGDFAAGTMVVKAQPGVGLDGLSAPRATQSDAPATLSSAMSASTPEADPLRQRFAAIRCLDSTDYELITDTLARDRQARIERTLVVRLAHAISAKMETEMAPDENARQFLENVAEAYRRYRR